MIIPSIPIHDFQLSLDAARVDRDLKAQLIKHLNSDALALLQNFEADGTCHLLNLAIRVARELYAKDPDRLVCVISASTASNAFAIWSSTGYDWVVLTEGLLTQLRASVDEVGVRITEHFSNILQSPLGRRILTTSPLSGGFQTVLGSLLYVAAICFFVGHEAGHHLEGHDGYFGKAAHAEIAGDLGPEIESDSLIKQALEFQADRHGVLISHLVLIRFIRGLADFKDYGKSERRQCNRVMAVLLSAGAFLALIKLRPRAIDWTYIGKSTHPPAVLRAVAASAVLTATFKKVRHLTEAERRWIRILTLELAAQGTIADNSNQGKMFRERSGRNEPAALRAVGIRALLYDRQIPAYIEKIEQSLELVKPSLQPRKRRTQTANTPTG